MKLAPNNKQRDYAIYFIFESVYLSTACLKLSKQKYAECIMAKSLKFIPAILSKTYF